MVLVLCKNKPLGDHVKCKDHLEREMLKEKGSRRAQIPADDKQWISVCLSRGPSEILHSIFTDFCLGLILRLNRLLFSPSNLFFLLFLLLLLFFPFLVYKRKVDLFQIPHSPGIFAFRSMAQNIENLFLQMVWSSNPQNSGSDFEGLCGWNVPAVLVEPIEMVNELPTRGAALVCCHF